jgi:hypothetical protein
LWRSDAAPGRYSPSAQGRLGARSLLKDAANAREADSAHHRPFPCSVSVWRAPAAPGVSRTPAAASAIAGVAAIGNRAGGRLDERVATIVSPRTRHTAWAAVPRRLRVVNDRRGCRARVERRSAFSTSRSGLSVALGCQAERSA